MGGVQCIDNGTNTHWNLSNQGNYWDDWTSPDSNTDGIVDNPYNLVGTAGAKDFYPRTKPVTTKKIKIAPNDKVSVDEDTQYSIHYLTTDTLSPSFSHTWTYKSNASWLFFNPTTHVLSGTPDNSDVGTYWVNVTASDGYSFDTHNFTLSVINVNDPPVIDTLNDVSVLEDENYLVNYNATDIDPTNDAITWSVKTNATFLAMDQASGNLSGTPDNADVGKYYVNVTASDGKGGTDFSNFTFTVIGVNDNPLIHNGTLPDCVEDEPFSFTVNATDEEQAWNTLDWNMTTKAGFLSFNATSFTLSGLPRNDDVGAHNVTLNVTDDDGGFKVLDFELIVKNTPPEINTTDILEAIAKEPYIVDYNSTDDGQGAILWTLHTNTGKWLAIDKNTGVLSGTPTDADDGAYWVNVNVSDGNGGCDITNFTLTVSSLAGPPFINTSMPDITMPEDTTHYIDLNKWFKDPAGDALTFRCSGNSNITIDILTNSSARLTPKSDWAGMENLVFFANDSVSETSDSIKVTVTNVNDAPEDVDFTLPTEKWYDGESKTLTGNATDPDLPYGDTLTSTWYADNAKSGEGKEHEFTLSEGSHIIKFVVSDKSGANITKEKSVMVYPKEIGDDDVDDDTGPNMALIIGGIVGGIVLLLIIVAVIVFMMMRKKKAAEKPLELEAKPQEPPTLPETASQTPMQAAQETAPAGPVLVPPAQIPGPIQPALPEAANQAPGTATSPVDEGQPQTAQLGPKTQSIVPGSEPQPGQIPPEQGQAPAQYPDPVLANRTH